MLGHSVSGSAVKSSRVGAQQKAQQLLLAASGYEERRGAAAASGQRTVVCLFGLMCRTDMVPSAAVSIQTSWQSWSPGLCYQCITGDHSCAGGRVGKRLHASSETSQHSWCAIWLGVSCLHFSACTVQSLRGGLTASIQQQDFIWKKKGQVWTARAHRGGRFLQKQVQKA